MCAETGEPLLKYAKECLDWHKHRIYQRDEDAKKLGIPFVLSEFGACMDTKDCAAEVTGVTQTCDDRLSSWMYWEYKPYNDITTSAGKSSEGFYNYDGTLE